jgi:glycosyltransferase involved in cell wall biosynthesis
MTPLHRIAYLVSRYPAVSHTFILREVRGLRDRGFDVQVASINDPDRPTSGLTREERDEAAQTFFVKRAGARGAIAAHAITLATNPWGYLRGLVFTVQLSGLDAALKHLAYFVEAIMIGQWMRRTGVQHLHVHFATPAATVALIATRVFAIEMSMTVHGPDEFDDVRGHHLAEKIAACRFVVCIGTYARSQLMRLSPLAHWSRFEVAPLGVDTLAFAPAPDRRRESPFEVLCVGRLVAAKGQSVLIRAIHQLIDSGRHLTLRLVGDGPDRAALEQLAATLRISDAVTFDGAINADGIRARYANADVFALASFAEGIPVVLMEAMSMGLPVVATSITGIPELIRPDVDGILVAPSDEDALASAIGALMNDEAFRARLGAAGRVRVQSRYDLPTNLDRLADVFRRRIFNEAPSPSFPARLMIAGEERS